MRWTLVLVVAALTVVAAGPALAGDNPTVVHAEEENVTAAPGETVGVDVVVFSEPGKHGVRVASVTLVADYDQSNLTVVDVKPHGWLEQGEPTNVNTTVDIDSDRGTVTVDQHRDPVAGGAQGYAPFATVTFEVTASGATNETISFERTDVEMTDDYRQPVFTHNATVVVDPSAETAGTGIGTRDRLPVVAATLLVGVVLVAVLVGRQYSR